MTVALLAGLLRIASASTADEAQSGPVGRWEFDAGTGTDLSGNGNDAELGGTQVYDLGDGRACLRVVPDAEPMRIPASPDSPLAIRRGTVCLWLNVAWEDSGTILEYDNDAIQLRVYRRHFQPRFKGADDFEFGANVLADDWPRFLLREGAFYPHEKAVVGEGEWHHFAVAYDDLAKRIVGWRDGEQIAVVDLSTLAVEPLEREGLDAIVTGDDFAGFLDDIRVYDRVLSGEDVREVFDSTRGVYADRDDTIPADGKMEVYAYQERDRSLHRAWLQYRPLRRRLGEDIVRRVVVEGADATIYTAADELATAVGSMFGRVPSIESRPGTGWMVVLGTPATSTWVRDRARELRLGRVRHDGYVIKAIEGDNGTTVVVAANVPAGVVFGVFDLVRRIQLGEDLARLDIRESPRNPIRMVNHWDTWRGFRHDDWHGRRIDPYNWESNRSNSIYSWEELRTGNTSRIRDWARLLASAGWNAVCPTEINWEFRNNFLEHLDEVETLAGIFRDYGIRLYWSPNYLLALRKSTADALYARVPDFGGYLLKLGSEKQNGDPRPAMVNQIADNLKPYGGYALVRAFVYGNYRYTPKPYRNLIPYDIFAPEDGHYRDNVIVVAKGSPLDWDFAAPIPALDGAIRKNLYGTELVIAKSWPVSWIEKWKWWMEQDNRRGGRGHLNKDETTCILGVSMISPAPAWTSCPLNMVNYYGLGRLAWNPDLTVDEIYEQWIRLTFGDDPDVLDKVKAILLLSDDVTRKLYLYRGYRGIWLDRGEDNLVQGKTPHTVTPEGIGVTSPELSKRILRQYAPGLRNIYRDPVKSEAYLPYFRFVEFDHGLSNGRTVIEDIYANLDEAVEGAERMYSLWKSLEGKVDRRRFEYTLANLAHHIETAREQRDKMAERFGEVTGRTSEAVMGGRQAREGGTRRTVRGWDIMAWEPEQMREQIDLAAEWRCNYISFSHECIFSFGELQREYQGIDPIERAEKLEEWCAYARSRGLDAYLWVKPFYFKAGNELPASVLADDGDTLLWEHPDLWRWFCDNLNMVLDKVPSCSGLNLTMSENAWQFYRASEREFDEKTQGIPFDPAVTEHYVRTSQTPVERIVKYVTEAHETLRARGKRLVLRDFWRTSNEHYNFWLALQQLPNDIMVQSKHVANDFRYCYPPSPSLGKYPERTQFLEFELGQSSLCAVDYFREQLQSACAAGVNGASVRCDPLEDELRDFTLYALTALMGDPAQAVAPLWRHYWRDLRGDYFGDAAALAMARKCLSRRFGLMQGSTYELGHFVTKDNFEPRKADQRLHIGYGKMNYTDDGAFRAEDLALREGSPAVQRRVVSEKEDTVAEAARLLAALAAARGHFRPDAFERVAGEVRRYMDFAEDKLAFVRAYFALRYYRNHPDDVAARRAAWKAYEGFENRDQRSDKVHRYLEQLREYLKRIDAGDAPNQPPVRPTGFRATATQGGVNLRWHDRADDEDYFVIERKEEWPGIWHIVATLPPDAETWTDENVEPGETYRYRMHAYGEGGERYYSGYTRTATVSLGDRRPKRR